jgi:transposase
MGIVHELETAGESLSPTVRAALVALETRVRQLEALEPVIERLQARIWDLEAQLRSNSTNSSRPPSSDPPGTAHPGKKKSGRKRGGQKGHPGHQRALLPPERIDAVVEHRPAACQRCGHSLAGAPVVGTPTRHQTIELPRVRAHVSEHRAFTLACPHCRAHTRARLPAEVRAHHFGPRLVAFATVLTSRFRLSRRNLPELLGDLLDVPAPALGTTQAFARESSAALREPYQEVRSAVRRAPTACVDETGWRLRAATRWIWTAAAEAATLFRIGRRRSTAERERLLGRDFAGVITTDRWRAYDSHPPERRQICWAHLRRNLQGFVDTGLRADLGAWGVRETDRLFHLWHRHEAGEISRAELRRAMVPVRMRVRRLLRWGAACEERRPRAFCRDLLRLWPSLWTFLGIEGAEPTSNRAERALRKPVIWRKCCFGSNSGAGLRFVERLLTAAETCRQQKRNLLDYLTAALEAHRIRAPAPRLLPAH